MPPIRQNKGKEPVRDDPLSQSRRPQTARRGTSLVKGDSSARTRRQKKGRKATDKKETADLIAETTTKSAQDTSLPSHIGLSETEHLASQIMFPPESFPLQESWPSFPIESNSSNQSILQHQEPYIHQPHPSLESVPMQREQPAFPIESFSYDSTLKPGPGSHKKRNAFPGSIPIQHQQADPQNQSARLPIRRGHPSFSNGSTPLNLLLEPWSGSQNQPALPDEPTSSNSSILQSQPPPQQSSSSQSIPFPQYDYNQSSLEYPIPFDEDDLLKLVQEYENELQQDAVTQQLSAMQNEYDQVDPEYKQFDQEYGQFDPAWFMDENDFSDLINPDNQTE